MTNFLKAVEWMKKGKKVRRKIWEDKDFYWYLDCPEYIHASITDSQNNLVTYFSPDLFEAEDYQIYRGKN